MAIPVIDPQQISPPKKQMEQLLAVVTTDTKEKPPI